MRRYWQKYRYEYGRDIVGAVGLKIGFNVFEYVGAIYCKIRMKDDKAYNFLATM